MKTSSIKKVGWGDYLAEILYRTMQEKFSILLLDVCDAISFGRGDINYVANVTMENVCSFAKRQKQVKNYKSMEQVFLETEEFAEDAVECKKLLVKIMIRKKDCYSKQYSLDDYYKVADEIYKSLVEGMILLLPFK